MTLPERLTLVRHGESEANIAQKLARSDRATELPKSFADRHDSFMRLSPLGVEQAKIAGDWLRENAGAPFDRFYVSPHVRTRETAANLGQNGDWFVDDRFRERDWGEVWSHKRMDPQTRFVKDLHEYYWKPTGGESMATGVRGRVESIVQTLYRRKNVNHVLAVSHGELIRMFQVVNERLAPEDFLRYVNDDSYKVQNTMIVQYSCVNPNNPLEQSNHYRWRRAVCPWDRTLDWDDGEWRDVEAKRHTDADLMAYALEVPPLFDRQ